MAIRQGMRGITLMSTMCFDCRFQNIYETTHEWIECKCKKDGTKHNPYRPMVMIKDCPNWQKEDDNADKHCGKP